MNTAPTTAPPGRFLKIGHVVAETSLAKATIYRRIKDGSFPRPRPLGGGRVAWAQRDIEEWKARIFSEGQT